MYCFKYKDSNIKHFRDDYTSSDIYTIRDIFIDVETFGKKYFIIFSSFNYQGNWFADISYNSGNINDLAKILLQFIKECEENPQSIESAKRDRLFLCSIVISFGRHPLKIETNNQINYINSQNILNLLDKFESLIIL